MLDIQNQFKYTVSLKQKKIMDFLKCSLAMKLSEFRCVFISP